MLRKIHNPIERFEHWDNIRNLLEKTRSVIEDELDFCFVPLGYRADRDADNIKALFEALDALCDAVNKHCNELDHEADTYENAYTLFEAWELGLCPKFMLQCIKSFRTIRDAGDSRTWQEISSFRQDKCISWQDTENAVMAWRTSRKKAG